MWWRLLDLNVFTGNFWAMFLRMRIKSCKSTPIYYVHVRSGTIYEVLYDGMSIERKYTSPN